MRLGNSSVCSCTKRVNIDILLRYNTLAKLNINIIIILVASGLTLHHEILRVELRILHTLIQEVLLLILQLSMCQIYVVLLSFSHKLRIIDMTLPCEDTIDHCLVIAIKIQFWRTSSREWGLVIFLRWNILLLINDWLSIQSLSKGRIMGGFVKLYCSHFLLIHLSKRIFQYSWCRVMRSHFIKLIICSFSIIPCGHVAQCWVQLPHIDWRRLIIDWDPLIHFGMESWIHHHGIFACNRLLTLNIHKLKLLY